MLAVSFVVDKNVLVSATTCDQNGTLQEWQSKTIMTRKCAAALATYILRHEPILTYNGDDGFRLLYQLSGMQDIHNKAKQQRDFQRDYANDTGGYQLDLRLTALHTLGATITASSASAQQAATLCALWQCDTARRLGKLLTPTVWILPAAHETIRPAHVSRPLTW